MSSVSVQCGGQAGAVPRDPAFELYERACDLRAAAAGLRAAAARRDDEAAVAATLGCLQAALADAAAVVNMLGEPSVRRISGAWPLFGLRATDAAHRAARDFRDTGESIRTAQRSCDALRETIGPLLAELSAL
jgi:hypothetical protein